MPQSSTLTYLAGDHLGSTSLTVDASSGDVTETRYKPWGEVRYTTANKTLPTRYTFTGQYSYVSDDATDLGNAGFGLMYYNARWYDPVLGRFAQADSIVPGGLQGLDRYAYVANNPIIYTDPSGHAQYHTGNWWSRHGSDHKQKNFTENDIIEYLKATYGEEWEAYYEAWKSDNLFWHMLLHASPGDILVAPTAGLQGFFGTSCSTGVLCFTDANGAQLTNYQGNGPYVLFRSGSPVYASYSYHPDATTTLKTPTWSQPIYDYSTGAPVFTGLWRVVTVNLGDFNPQFLGPSGVPFIVSGGTGLAQRIGSWAGAKFLSVLTPIGNWLLIISALGYLYNSVLRYDQIFDVSIISGPDPRYLVIPAQPPLLGVPQFH